MYKLNCSYVLLNAWFQAPSPNNCTQRTCVHSDTHMSSNTKLWITQNLACHP